MQRLTLASASPRRRQLLDWAGWQIDVRPPRVDESRVPGLDPVAWAQQLARSKADTADPEALVVAADTVVHRDGRVFDKPADREQARAHLRDLSGGWHQVTTAVCVRHGSRHRAFAVTTEVRFRTLGEEEIHRYAASGEADDKAGAYGIQGLGGALVAEVRGSWTNVMGLPLEQTLAALEELSDVHR